MPGKIEIGTLLYRNYLEKPDNNLLFNMHRGTIFAVLDMKDETLQVGVVQGGPYVPYASGTYSIPIADCTEEYFLWNEV